ncbi:MAG: PhzF family phenazine biosynthesis protein [Candidatus Bipolaricaulota bacterium]
MPCRFFLVDAFADRPFAGNPAGVCILDRDASAEWMQSVASEVNASETAFARRRDDGTFHLRWFTPRIEVDLCGHATLATAHVLWASRDLAESEMAKFHTRSGPLTAVRREAWIELDFPACATTAIAPPAGLLEALGVKAVFVGRTRSDVLIEVDSEAAVRSAAPDFAALRRVGVRGAMVTARSATAGVDFVSRFFAPGVGIDEDPVTGSAHCALAPYWAQKLAKDDLSAHQASARGGFVRCHLAGDRVLLSGKAVTIFRGEGVST